MNYEAVFIDWDGTLSNSRFWERWRDDPARAGRYDKIQEKLFGSEEGKEVVRTWMTGTIDYEHALSYVALTTGLEYGELEQELRYSAENMRLIDQGVLPTIQQLRDMGKHVVIATDNMDTFSKWTVPSLGLDEHFDDVLNSYKIRTLKSEIHQIQIRSTFFHHYMYRMGIAPKDTVLIDNSPEVQRLESVGMNVLHVTDERPLSYHLDQIVKNS